MPTPTEIRVIQNIIIEIREHEDIYKNFLSYIQITKLLKTYKQTKTNIFPFFQYYNLFILNRIYIYQVKNSIIY